MTALADLERTLALIAPPTLAEPWDNVGWQVRCEDTAITGIVVCVDSTEEVISEARDLGANVILSHHPLLFRPLRSLDARSRVGRSIAQATRQGISIIAAHTNWDAAPSGVSWALARALDLVPETTLQPHDGVKGAGFGVLTRSLRPIQLTTMLDLVETKLGSPVSLVAGGEPVHSHIALMGGSGTGAISAAAALGATLYITADVRYHDAQEAESLGLTLLVIDHAASEQPGMLELTHQIRARLSVPVYASRVQTTPWQRMNS